MYKPKWPFLLTYGSHDMRLTGFCRLTVVNGTPGKWGVTSIIPPKQYNRLALGGIHIY